MPLWMRGSVAASARAANQGGRGRGGAGGAGADDDEWSGEDEDVAYYTEMKVSPSLELATSEQE